MGSPRTISGIVYPQSAYKGMLAPLLAVGGLLDPTTTHLHLIASPLIPSKGTTLAELVASEPTYAEYAPQVGKPWGASYTGEDGRAEADAMAPNVFPGPAAGSGPTIYGVFVTDIAGDVLKAIGMFSAPFPLTDDGTALVVLMSSYIPGV